MILPPTTKSPPIPTPPVIRNAPVFVEVAATADVTTTLPDPFGVTTILTLASVPVEPNIAPLPLAAPATVI